MLRCRVRGTIDSHDIPARQDAIEAGETPAVRRRDAGAPSPFAGAPSPFAGAPSPFAGAPSPFTDPHL
jgi:hypothetical protein